MNAFLKISGKYKIKDSIIEFDNSTNINYE